MMTLATVFAQELKCTNHPARSWWDVRHYKVSVKVDTATGFLQGAITIRVKVRNDAIDSLQIDLQPPMHIVSVTEENAVEGESSADQFARLELGISTQGNGIYYIRRKPEMPPFSEADPGSELIFTVRFEGRPQQADNAPWDGGIVLSRDPAGGRWIAMACQGIGASVWLPVKDHPADEPEEGIDMYLNVPSGLQAISNGKLLNKTSDSAGRNIWHWKVVNPINNYNITFYIGNYKHLGDTFAGRGGLLDLDYYVLPGHQEDAERQFQQVKTMLSCFEQHFGPYPFYEDGYKIVESPYLGMEHQSAIAYGNKFRNGYLGEDRSKSGTGLLFDFILIHESAHEWFGNSISVADPADTWVQEGFTTYAETLYAERVAGKAAALAYQRGKRRLIQNDRAVMGQHRACDAGSLDHYDKAAYMLHMIRVLIADDPVFFALLREINSRFFHQVVTGKEVEAFLIHYLNTAPYQSSVRFSPTFFDQYLREADLPVLLLKRSGNRWTYRWSHCAPGFNMPVIWKNGKVRQYLYPTEQLNELPADSGFDPKYILPDFLIEITAE